ncbi:exopolysaccharide Pel transporter PelG [Histidinibacterium aquaticum]|uniref:Uncharacterized protein n=1 Tax=Histidinibacterium aquaticum TaxID=2613962 RepID=A0A5J5GMN6_9RHOB|nr:exopolysaccharide Pel transporter PelG [Histidinibacterium aquaticum]KAA9009435.1 hypothetical protein F3S47_09340 [Histidinibacterium aquaticum]
MAGIGVRLDELALTGGLSGRMSVYVTGAVLTSGQWLLAIIGIGVLGVIANLVTEREVVTDFRLVIVYVFATAGILTGTFSMATVRQISNELYLERPEEIPGIVFGLLCTVSLASVPIGIALFAGLAQIDGRMLPAAVIALVALSQLWVLALVTTALAEVRTVILSYLAGTIVSVALAYQAARTGQASEMVLGYTAGVVLTVVLQISVFFRAFPFSAPPIADCLRTIREGVADYLPLALGGLFAAAAIWADNIVLWYSRFGVTAPVGLRYAPNFDAAKFYGLLCLVPGFTAIVFFEARIFVGLRRHLARIMAHATLAEIDLQEGSLRERIVHSLRRLVLTQAAVALLVILLAPGLASAGLLAHRSVPIMQMTAIGTVFHILLAVCGMVLLYLDAQRGFCAVQLAFLVCVLAASLMPLVLGPRYLGVAYPLGAAFAGSFALRITLSTLDRLNERLFTPRRT